MATPVFMPKFEMSQEVGTIIEWLKKDGEKVQKGEAILSVETDKVNMEVECPATGILAGIRGEPGDEIPVTEIIGYVLKEGEKLPEMKEGAKASLASAVPEEKPAASAEAEVRPAKVTPVAEKMAESMGVNLNAIAGTGTGGKITKADVAAAAESSSTAEVSDKVRATPAARRVARENEMDLTAVSGTGPRQRIQGSDVVAALSAAPAAQPAQPVQPVLAGESVPFAGMRRKIADRLTASYQNAPHIYLTVKVDMTEMDAVRKQLNAKAKATNAAHVSATALLVKAVAWALKRNPYLNSTLTADSIELLPHVNIGMAVAIDRGLIVPVIQDADQKPVSVLAAQVNDLAGRARDEKLIPAEVAGGTFTISNLGAFGVEEFTAIINPGQSGILAVGAIQREVVPGENDVLEVRPMMRMTLSVDHRVVDGAVAAKFLKDLREVIESPSLLLW